VGVLWSGHVAERSFGDWTMGFVNGQERKVRDAEGYRDFFGKKTLEGFWANPSRATELLRQFRELPLRRTLAGPPQVTEPTRRGPEAPRRGP
jgi:hypothetical protein